MRYNFDINTSRFLALASLNSPREIYLRFEVKGVKVDRD